MSTISPYGTRSQTAALTRAVEDALGNKDGIAGNESRPAGSANGGPLASNPLLARLQSSFAPGLSTRDEQASLAGFVREREVAWGAPVTSLTADEVPHFEAFRTEKAAALVRFDRQPGEVTEGFLRAAGSVDGEDIAPREIFWQRWAPTAPPSGKVVVISPGFQETGRNFLEQVQLLNAQGHDVVLMDHQWAGYTKGNPGGLDRGYGVARDVAATAAFAQQLADREYAGRPHEVVLFGNSMGAGPGVLGALALNDAGKVQLEGAQMPKGLSAVLQAPFLQMKAGLLNQGLEVMSRIPLLKELPLPSMGLPVLTHDDAAAAKLAQHVVLEGVVARPQAMSAADGDLASIWKLVESGAGPQGRVSIVHGDRDPLADVEGSRRLAGLLGDRAQLQELSSSNHVLEEEAGAQRHVLEALKWLD
jgi:alpha-beta hydrolase superfamily lysophospholipase